MVMRMEIDEVSVLRRVLDGLVFLPLEKFEGNTLQFKVHNAHDVEFDLLGNEVRFVFRENKYSFRLRENLLELELPSRVVFRILKEMVRSFKVWMDGSDLIIRIEFEDVDDD